MRQDKDALFRLFDTLRSHRLILDAIKYDQRGLITPDTIISAIDGIQAQLDVLKARQKYGWSETAAHEEAQIRDLTAENSALKARLARDS